MASASALSALQPVKLLFIGGPTLKPLSMHAFKAATSLPHARCAGTEISHPIAPALVSAVPKAAVLADGALALSDRLATAERELGQLCSQLKTHAGPFTVQELYRLPHAALDRLRSLWLTVQRNRLALLGHADHLFDSAFESHSQRGKFVVADGDSLMFFDDEDAAVDAAAAVAVRLLGPLGCVAYARAGEPLPPPYAMQPGSAENADILQQMSQLHEVVGGHSVAYPGEDVLPCMDVLIFMFDAAGVARSVTSCPAVYDTGAIDKVYVGNTAADLRTPSSFGGTFGRTVYCHPSSEAAAFSALRCSCGPVVTIASKATCPLWTKLVVGNAPRTYLDWKDHPVFVIGAPVVSKRWGLSVLGTADGRFGFVKLASEDLERGGASADFCAASDSDGAGGAADL